MFNPYTLVVKDKLYKIAEDITNNFAAPGLPDNYTTLITRDVQVIQGLNGTSCCLNKAEIESAICNNLAPLALRRGISCSGINMGNFIESRHYLEPEEILNNKIYDYDLDEQILNYIYSIISTVGNLDKLKENEIVMITYSAEAGISSLERFENMDKLEDTIYNKYEIERIEN